MTSTASASHAKIDIDFNSKEPWSSDTVMIIPVDKTQVLMPESASILGVHAFLKMTHLPYEVVEMINAASISPTGKVPVLKSGPYVISELESIVQLAAAKGVSLSEHLNVSEKADLRAYMSLVHNVLETALLYFTWMDDDIYSHITKPRVGSPYNFPLSHLVPWDFRRKAKAQLNGLKWSQKKPNEVCQDVETCFSALAERLGEREFFFGAHPTELDALVFGYCFLMITMKLSDTSPFGDLVKEHANLVRLCQRLEKDYFPSENSLKP